ncbi:MAG: hypothetical protein NTZ78_08790 [Candidatus Aureabacteria bacterium]|nr:hypothetical protein [Candidatus Auribacterota bacterium]
MKKGLIIGVALAALCLGVTYASKCPESFRGHKTEKGEWGEMCPMHGAMGMSMMRRTAIATQDGGVVVMQGNKIMKYDKDLNLQKEAELKCDMEGMHKMMKEMHAGCPMCKEMKGKCEMGWKGGHKEKEESEE